MINGIKDIMRGFKDFLMRGNVIDLAVAVVIGAAFTAVVKSISDFLINPLLAVFGGVNAEGLGFRILPGNSGTYIDLGKIITASIQFVITAAVIYFLIVLPMKKAQERRRAGVAEPEPVLEPEADIALLTEIRDLLREGISPTPALLSDEPSPTSGAAPASSAQARSVAPDRAGEARASHDGSAVRGDAGLVRSGQ